MKKLLFLVIFLSACAPPGRYTQQRAGGEGVGRWSTDGGNQPSQPAQPVRDEDNGIYRADPPPTDCPPDVLPPATGTDLPTYATEAGGRPLTDAEWNQWRANRAAQPEYRQAVREMQAYREDRARTGSLTAFDGGRCTLAQSAAQCREARAYMDASAGRWTRDSRAAREAGEP